MMLRFLLIMFFFSVQIDAIEIDNKTEFYDLLKYSKIYVDKSKSLTIQDITKIKNKFKENSKNLLSYGYSPDFNVWVKFTLKNTTNKPLSKILEYDNPLTTHMKFYSPEDAYMKKEGLYQITKDRKTINPIFNIKLQAKESKTYYIRASSHITTLIVKLKLYSIDGFYAKEIKYQLILGLFFASMLVLGIYNLFIYFFTKDISYLYYVLYIFGVILHQMIYVGIANIYLLNQNWSIYFIEYSSILVAFPIYFFALFTKIFLDTKNYSIINKVLNLFLIIIPISIIIFISFDMLQKYRHILNILLVAYLIMITIYITFQKNRQAFFLLFGWFIVLISAILMYLSSIGIFDVNQYQPYLVEISFVIEAIIFSIALADRIRQLQVGLKVKVKEKTIDLKNALDEKELLLKELNHRVKNNMQTIVSLIRLQSDEIEDKKLQEILLVIQNRVNAMSHLHELLYKQCDISYVNAYEYFDILSEDIINSYDNDVDIIFDIKTKLKMEHAVYCGLILNELISNSCKHAFLDANDKIHISLYKDTNLFVLSVDDNGIGYDENMITDSLGLTLINTLVIQQLKGKIKTDTSNGVKVKIYWENNE